MKPITYGKFTVLLCVVFCGLILYSCDQVQSTPYDDENIRVIEFDYEPKEIPEYELNATTEELSEFDCDLNWILFDFNSSDLTNEAKIELEKVALIIDQNNTFKARLRAFTDSKGSVEYNEKLSRRRALSAKQYLMQEGIPAQNISIDSYADAKPIAKNTEDDTGRKYNRRIELFVLDRLNNTVCRSHPPKVPKELKTK